VLDRAVRRELDLLADRVKDTIDRLRHEKQFALLDELRGHLRAAGLEPCTSKDGLSYLDRIDWL
jgi:hypothetical protein